MNLNEYVLETYGLQIKPSDSVNLVDPLDKLIPKFLDRV